MDAVGADEGGGGIDRGGGDAVGSNRGGWGAVAGEEGGGLGDHHDACKGDYASDLFDAGEGLFEEDGADGAGDDGRDEGDNCGFGDG